VRVEAALLAGLPGAAVHRLANTHDHGSLGPGRACDAGCIRPLQRLAAAFASASALMVSSKSNMGSFLLSYWPAANGDAVPPLVDMDGKVKAGQLHKGARAAPRAAPAASARPVAPLPAPTADLTCLCARAQGATFASWPGARATACARATRPLRRTCTVRRPATAPPAMAATVRARTARPQ
jgi:hypothetical protein